MITVVGSYNTDMICNPPHLPLPGETIIAGGFRTGVGGKGGNQAVAAARAGSKVAMVTKLGTDDFAGTAKNNFIEEGIDISYTKFTDDAPTGIAIITVAEDTAENTIVVVPGANAKITKQDIDDAKQAIIDADILLLQLEIAPEAIIHAINIAGENGVKVVLNPAPYMELPEEIFKHITYITPNETEASYLSGIEVIDDKSAVAAANAIMDMGVDKVVITMSKRGCLVCEDKSTHYFVDAFKMDKVVDTTGAGDAFNGGFCHALEQGKSMREAAVYGNATGGLSVTKPGAAPSAPYKAEIEEFLRLKGV